MIILLVSVCGNLSAQTINKTFEPTTRTLYTLYSQAIGYAAALYNGPEYVPTDINIGGHPFFKSKNLLRGTVIYDGIVYERVELGYDIYRDVLAVVYYDGDGNFSLMQPRKDRIEGFIYDDHEFIYLQKNDYTGIPQSGLYEQLSNGSLQVFVRHTKKVRPSPSGTYRYEFFEQALVVVQKDGTFFQINSAKALMRLLQDKKKILRKIKRDHDEGFEEYVVEVCNYYERLIETSN